MAALINILGTQRSGSTLLGAMLNSDDAFHCGEAYAWFRPSRTHHRTLICPCGASPCPVWEELAQSSAREFHHRAVAQTDSRAVVDSSKDLTWVVDAHRWARGHDMQTMNLLVWRAPATFAAALAGRGIPYAAARAEFLTYHQRLIALGMPFSSVPLMELLRGPDEVLQRISASAEISLEPGQVRYWERPSHHLFGSPTVMRHCRSRTGFLGSAEREAALSDSDLERMLRSDREVQEVVEALRHRDFSSHAPAYHRWSQGIARMPRWYWRRRMKAALDLLIPSRREAWPSRRA